MCVCSSASSALPSSLTLVTGGARSGKSAFAEQLAAASGEPVTFVATAEALDDDMRERIARHRNARPAGWQTLEEPLSVGVSLRSRGVGGTVLLDCVTLLVSNLLLAGRAVLPEIEAIVAWQRASSADLIAVTNEVGLGVVPDNALARSFRDELGLANQALAAAADRVILMVAGLPLQIKE